MKKVRAFALLMTVAASFLVGCKAVPMGDGSSPPKREKPEYDCRKHAKDKVCEVPWKDKVVLYCYKGKIPKVVRFREEC